MTQILRAAPIVEKEKERLKSLFEEQHKKRGRPSHLAIILVGDDPASQVYTAHKKKFAHSLGASCTIHTWDKDLTPEVFLRKTKELVEAPENDGILIQLPLPKQLNNIEVDKLIPFEKDVDGFHPLNIDAIVRGKDFSEFLPCCTPQGVLTLLDHYEIKVAGKKILVIGRSMIVGKPLSLMLLGRDATVTMTHSRGSDLRELTKSSDIIISAVGRPQFIDSSYIRRDKSQILIDVGINRHQEKLVGDFHFDDLKDHVKAITPVPGSIGPLTILSLAKNLARAVEGNFK